MGKLRHLALLAGRLARAASTHDVVEAVVQAGAVELACDAVSLYLLDDTGCFVDTASRGADPMLSQRFARFPLDEQLPAGQAVLHERPVVWQSVAERNARFPSFGGYGEGAASLVCAPMVVGEGIRIGVLSFGWGHPERIDEDTLHFAVAAAELCGQAIHRARLYDEQVRQAARDQFLAAASAALTASLDLEATLQSVVDLAVPGVADVCSIGLREADGLRTVAWAAAHPAEADAMARLVARRPINDSPVLLDILLHGEALVMPRIDAEERLRGAADEEERQLLVALDASSTVIVPLRHGDDAVGLLILLNTRSARTVGAAELLLADNLATRAAVAIDHARTHTAVVGHATNLEHALETRIVVEQAKGVLAERWQVPVAAAFERLRREARTRRVRIHELASGVLDGTLVLDPPTVLEDR